MFCYDDNPFVSCPYNPAHRLLQSRIQMHLTKCEKHYPPLEICPHNHSHRLKADKYLEHVSNCPSKPLNINDLGKSINEQAKHPFPDPMKVIKVNYQKRNEDEEYWDLKRV